MADGDKSPPLGGRVDPVTSVDTITTPAIVMASCGSALKTIMATSDFLTRLRVSGHSRDKYCKTNIFCSLFPNTNCKSLMETDFQSVSFELAASVR